MYFSSPLTSIGMHYDLPSARDRLRTQPLVQPSWSHNYPWPADNSSANGYYGKRRTLNSKSCPVPSNGPTRRGGGLHFQRHRTSRKPSARMRVPSPGIDLPPTELETAATGQRRALARPQKA